MLGPSGEYLSMSLTNYGNTTNPNWYLQEWNSSRIWDNSILWSINNANISSAITNGATTVLVNGTNQAVANDFNVSIPWLNTATLNGAP